MYKKKTLQMSDLEATDYEMEKAVLASSLESYQKNEQSRKQPWSNRDRRRQHNSSPVSSRNSSRYVSVSVGFMYNFMRHALCVPISCFLFLIVLQCV